MTITKTITIDEIKELIMSHYGIADVTFLTIGTDDQYHECLSESIDAVRGVVDE